MSGCFFFTFKHSLSCARNIDNRIFFTNALSQSLWPTYICTSKIYPVWKFQIEMLIDKLFGIFLFISHIIALIVWNFSVWLLSICLVCLGPTCTYVQLKKTLNTFDQTFRGFQLLIFRVESMHLWCTLFLLANKCIPGLDFNKTESMR